jgi:hypothetical protein
MVNLPVLAPVCSKNSYPADPIPMLAELKAGLPRAGVGEHEHRELIEMRKRQGGESSGWRQA